MLLVFKSDQSIDVHCNGCHISDYVISDYVISDYVISDYVSRILVPVPQPPWNHPMCSEP